MGLRVLIVAFLLPVLWAQSASAVQITYAVSGQITEIRDNPANDGRSVLDGSEFAVGDAFTGSISWDTTIPDEDPDPADGRFTVDPTLGRIRISMSFDIIQASSDPNALSLGAVLDDDDNALVRQDRFFLISFGAVDNLPDALGNLRVFGLQTDLVSNDLTALGSDALPTTLDLALFDRSRRITALLTRRGATAAVIGRIDTLTRVPEPSTALVFAFGLGAALFARRN